MPCSKSLKPRQRPSSSCETSVTAFGARSYAQIVQGDYVTDFRCSSQPVSTEERPIVGLDTNRSQGQGQGHSQGHQKHDCSRKVNSHRKRILYLASSISHFGFACELPYTISRIPGWINSCKSSLVNARVKDSVIAEEMSTWGPSMLVDRWSGAREALEWVAREAGE